MKMRRRLPRRLLYVAVVLLLLLVAAVVGVRYFYNENLGPVSNSQQAEIITIPSGSSVKEISQILADKKVISKAWAFEWYVHSKELTDDLKAGTYAITPSSSLPQIATTLTQGKVTSELVTILPGRRIDQVRTDLINDGFSVEAVDAALKPDQYRDLPVMTYVPADTETLEGFLYPESFQRIEGTDPAQIIRESLKAMGAEITPKMQAAFASKGLNVFQAVTLASLVEREVSIQSERDQVAQVFLTRLSLDMTLGSDVTGLYGSVKAGRTPSVTFDSPYNTRIYKGLPPGPISSVSSGALKAVANPAPSDWVYFVSGDDGITRFSKTLEEHEALTNQYCRKNCGRE